jgi:diguanylate cyclase (GGDEF)-like protein
MKILLAEDQRVAARFIERMLKEIGHEVTVVPDGEVAWQIVRAGETPVLISDWLMPRLDGLELCRRIRAAESDHYTYIILLTSRDRYEDKLQGLDAGADDFLTKPPNPHELSVRLRIAERIVAIHEKLARQNRRLAELAMTDELTGVKNRRRFLEDFELYAALAVRQRMPLSLVVLDVDHFKQYNDTFGHPAGDQVLRTVAATLSQNVREHDVVARYGGEEFVVVLPATDAHPALELAERLRLALEQQSGTPRQVTASFGVATLDRGGGNVASLIEEADRALYRAKGSGRNRVCHFRDVDAASLGYSLVESDS